MFVSIACFVLTTIYLYWFIVCYSVYYLVILKYSEDYFKFFVERVGKRLRLLAMDIAETRDQLINESLLRVTQRSLLDGAC